MPYELAVIKIYADVNNKVASPSTHRYYFTPISRFDVSSVTINRDSSMTFQLEDWNKEVVRKVTRLVALKIGYPALREVQVTLIDYLHCMPLDSSPSTSGYEWDLLYTDFHSRIVPERQFVWLRVVCNSTNTCQNLAEQLKSNPYQLISRLKFFYRVSYDSESRQIPIKIEDVMGSTAVSKVSQRFPNAFSVLVAFDIVSSVIDVILKPLFDDKDMLMINWNSKAAMHQILSKQVMEATNVNMTVDSWMDWNYLSWEIENFRPDRAANIFNNIYFNLSAADRPKFVDFMSKRPTEPRKIFDFYYLGLWKAMLIMEGFNNVENFREFLNKVDRVIEWKEKDRTFGIKSFTATRINLFRMRDPWYYKGLTFNATFEIAFYNHVYIPKLTMENVMNRFFALEHNNKGEFLNFFNSNL